MVSSGRVDAAWRIAEARIREAIAKGELDRLPRSGKPIVLEDLSGVPDDLRVGYKLLKNAGVLPEELELRKEALTLEAMIAACTDEAERRALRRKASEKELRYRLLLERRGRTAAHYRYERAIRARLGR